MPNDTILTWSDYAQEPKAALDVPRSVQSYRDYIEHFYRLNFGEELPEMTPPLPRTPVLVNVGRWLWQCQACGNAMPVEPNEPLICFECAAGGWMMPEFPTDKAAIEEELLRQPGRRLAAPIRHWLPGQTLEALAERTAKAQEAIARGNPYPRALSIGSTRIWATGEVLSASNMNTFISEVSNDLAGRNGPVELEDALQLDSLTTAQRNARTAANGMLLYNETLNKLQGRENGAWVGLGPSEIIGIGNFGITQNTRWALEINSADITLPTPGTNEIWGFMARDDNVTSHGLFLGSWLTTRDSGTYGGTVPNNQQLQFRVAYVTASTMLSLGHTIDNKLLVRVTDIAIDPMPLVLFRFSV